MCNLMTKSLFLYFLIVGLVVEWAQSSSSSNTDKLYKQMKHASKPSSKVNCSKLTNDFKPTVIHSTFMVTSDRKSLVSRKSKNSLLEFYSNQCDKNSIDMKSTTESNELNLIWRYQFFESVHCIRVELDLVNVTRFTDMLDYGYYMFSYRELGHKNIHLERQPIVEAVNSLTIARAYIRPYIVCVSFFKNNIIPTTTTANATSTNTNNTSNKTAARVDCDGFAKQLLNDQKLQNIDLCIDIGTPMHFLSVSGHEESHEKSLSHGQLLMVSFILCLVGVVLATIATCQFFIDRPRKRRMKAVKEYLAKRAHHLFQSTGSHGSLNKDKLLGSNPSMIIVPHVFQEMSQSQYEPSEGEALLAAHGSNASFPPVDENGSTNQQATNTITATAQSSTNGNGGKITFSVGETILEDLAGEAATSTSGGTNVPTAAISSGGETVGTTTTKTTTAEEATTETIGETSKEPVDIIEGTEEAVKTVSHLLDDKPWSLTRRDSKPFTVEKTPMSTNLASSGSQARFNI